MYRLILVMMITAIAWSSVGCGGPGKPVTRSSELRDRAGGGTTDNSNPGPGVENPQKPDQSKNGDDGKTEEGTSTDDDSKPDESSGTDGEVDPDSDKDKSAEPDPKSKAPAPIPSTRRRNRPPGLGIGIPGGDSEKTDKKDKKADDKEAADKEDDAVDEDETPPATVSNEMENVEKHRFTFFERANYAFSTENETEGFQYLYAHVIAEDGALSEHPIAWYSGISEPRLGLRWGVGIDYSPGNFDGDPPRFDANGTSATSFGSRGGSSGEVGNRNLGDRLPNGQRRQSSSSSSGSRSAGSAPDGEDPIEQLIYYTSDFGELLLQRIEVRRTNSDYYWGKALSEIDATKTFEEKKSRIVGGIGNRSERDGKKGGKGGTGLRSEDDLDAIIPESIPTTSGSKESGNRRLPVLEMAGFEPEFTAAPTSLVPGAITLGLGNRAELLERARAHGLDLIAVFDVSVQVSSKDEAKTTIMVTIVNVKTGEKVADTRKLNTLAYAIAMESGKENPIELELDKLFPDTTDKEYKCSELPTITSDRASQRVEELLENKSDNPLPILVEIKHYVEHDLISKTEYIAAAETLIGVENARKLVDGDINEREEALHDWLPGQYSVNISNSDEFR